MSPSTAASALELETLRLFLAVMRAGALHKAAAELGLTVPTASRALAQLRVELDDALFVKTGGGMVPTPRALAIRARVEELVARLEALRTAEEFVPARSSREFHVAVPDNGFLIFLGKVIPAFTREAPAARLRVHQVTARVHAQLREGHLDLAIFPAERLPPDFEGRPLADSVMVCLLRRDHPLVAATPPGARPSLEAFRSYRRAFHHVPRGHEALGFDQEFFGMDLGGAPTVDSPYFVGVPLVLVESDLVTILPLPTAEHFARLLPLAILPTPVPSRPFRPLLIWHRRVEADAAVRWFRSLFDDLG